MNLRDPRLPARRVREMTARSITYHPSAVEAQWFPPAKPACTSQWTCDRYPGPTCCPYKFGKVCNISASPSQTSATPEWLRFANASWGPSPREPTAAEAAVLSRMDRDGCSEHIEPLTGIGRHPLAAGMGCPGRVTRQVTRELPWALRNANKYSIGHLILANHCGATGEGGGSCRRRESTRQSKHGGGRNLFYDLGCSVYGSRQTTHLRTAENSGIFDGSGKGSSLRVFSHLYESNCLKFDRIWAWEAQKYDAQSWWKPVPHAKRHKIHFYNVPVDFEAFVQTLKASATPSDFVVVKVDIDGNPALEKRIVQAIAHQPELSSLVDELFFEYHVHWDGGHNPWLYAPPYGGGKKADGKCCLPAQTTNPELENYMAPDSIDDALKLMRELREAGVRSHFWV